MSTLAEQLRLLKDACLNGFCLFQLGEKTVVYETKKDIYKKIQEPEQESGFKEEINFSRIRFIKGLK